MTTPGFTLAIALAAGVLAQSVSRQLRFPGIVLLLATGTLVGPEGLGWVRPDSLGEGLFSIVEFGIAIILFEGGLNLEWSRLRRQEAAIRRLITVGALVTFLGATLLSRLVLAWHWDLSLLFGSLVIVTGPTVVAPLLRTMRLRPRLKTVLEAEGVLIDPMGALLAGFVLPVVTTPEVLTVAAEVWTVTLSIGFGVVAGGAAGVLVVGALRYRLLVARGFETIFTLAAVVMLFEACDEIVAPSGLVAVTVAGIVVGNVETRAGDQLREFKDRLTIMLVGLLFVLLSADVALADVQALGSGGAVVVGALVLAVRPAGVWAATRGLTITPGERTFMSAIAPRGIVAAAIASITAAALADAGIDGGPTLKALVFLTIAGTVVVSGAAAHPLAWLLDLRLPRRDRVAILGARGLAIALATELREAKVPVVFLESDPKRSRVAEEAGFPVVFGDPLDDRTLLRARPEVVGSAIGLTFSEHFNSLFVQQALDGFDVPRGYVAMESLFGEKTPSLVKQPHADVLFDGPHDHERWDSRWRHDQVVVERFTYGPARRRSSEATAELGAPSQPKPPGPRSQERYVILAVTRGARIAPMHMSYTPRQEDVASIALFGPERDEARAALAELGWQPTPTTSDSNEGLESGRYTVSSVRLID